MRDREAVNRISKAVLAVRLIIKAGYPSVGAKQMIRSLVTERLLSNKEAIIVADIFGFKNTDNSIYFSSNNAREITQALGFLDIGIPSEGSEILRELPGILSLVQVMEVAGKMSPVASTLVRRLVELDCGMRLINYTIDTINTSNKSKIYQAVNSRIRDLASVGVCNNSIRLLKLIYGVGRASKEADTKQSKQGKADGATSQKTIFKKIKLDNFCIFEAFIFESGRLYDLSIKNFEAEREELNKDKLRELIEALEERRIRAKLIIEKEWLNRIIFSGDFKLDAFLEVSDNTKPVLPNGNKRYIKMYDLYETYGEQIHDELLDYAKQFNGADVKRVVYRANIDGRMTFVSLDEKYKRTIDRLKEILMDKNDTRQSSLTDGELKIKVQHLSDLGIDISIGLDKNSLHERLSMFGPNYLTKLLEVYREHFIELVSLKIEPNEVLILDDFKLDAYIKSPCGDIIKIFKGSGKPSKCVFTPEFKAYIKGKSCNNVGHVVYRVKGKDSMQYVEAEQIYNIAIAQIKEWSSKS